MWLKNLAGRVVEIDDSWDIKPLLESGFKIAESPYMPIKIEYPQDAKFYNLFRVSHNELDSDGYGVATKNLVRLLEDSHYYIDNNKDYKTYVIFHTPPAIGFWLNEQKQKGKDWTKFFKVAITMWETTKLPDGWISSLNLMDLIIVPSQFCARSFKASGIVKPVKIMPLPLDVNNYQFKKRPVDRKPFVFLQYAQLTPRKGWQYTIKAFQQEFQNEKDVRLILKSKIGLPIEKPSDPRVMIYCDNWPKEKMLQMLYDADCFVNPSQGEGYGMCDMEAMCSGLTTISTYAHSLKDHLTEDIAYLLKESQLRPVGYDEMMSWKAEFENAKGGTIGNWYRPTLTELKEKMRYAFEHRQETSDKGEKAAQYIRDNYCFEALRPKILNIFKDFV